MYNSKNISGPPNARIDNSLYRLVKVTTHFSWAEKIYVSCTDMTSLV